MKTLLYECVDGCRTCTPRWPPRFRRVLFFVCLVVIPFALPIVLFGCADYGQLDQDRTLAAAQADQANEVQAQSDAAASAMTHALTLLEPGTNAHHAMSLERDLILQVSRDARELSTILREQIASIDQQIVEAEASEDSWLGLAGTLGVLAGPLFGGITIAIPAILGAVVHGRRQRKGGAEVIVEALAVGRATIPEFDNAFRQLTPVQTDALNTLYGDLANVVQASKRVSPNIATTGSATILL